MQKIFLDLYKVKGTRGKACKAAELHRPVEERVRRVNPSSSNVSLQAAPPTAVTSEAEGYISGPQGQGDRLSTSAVISESPPPLSLQQQPPLPALSAHDGSATSLSSLE